MTAGLRRHKVRFDKAERSGRARFGSGVSSRVPHITLWVEFIYQGGSVAVEGGRDAGRERMKVRLRASPKAREIAPKDRMEHLLRGEIYEVQEVDAVTQRGSVYLVVEGPLSAETAHV